MIDSLDAIVVSPASPVIGAVVTGVDLANPLPRPMAAGLRAVLRDHHVVVYRGQKLDPQSLVRYGRLFGELDDAPMTPWGRRSVPGHDEIYIVSNIVENGRPIGALGCDAIDWHSDLTFRRVPPSSSCLYAIEVPESGGDTSFLSLFDAYERLPVRLKARIQGLSLKHDATTNSAGELRRGFAEPVDVSTSPGMIHPLVRRDVHSGRRALNLGRRRHAYICGLPIPESEALLDELWDRGVGRAKVWTHHWQPGDLVQWDNRWTMHARSAFDRGARRIMHRIQIRAEI